MLGHILVLLGLCCYVFCALYTLQDTYIGPSFFSGFEWQAIPDPTHGRVNYVDQPTATQNGLSYASGTSFVMRVDDTTVLSPEGPGRQSVRIRSTKTYTTALTVLNLNHMPEGCATWPAFWTVSESNWPNGGEIDIIEYVNSQGPNHETLHASANCSMPASLRQTGQLVSTNCDVAANYNEGCSTLSSSPTSAGPGFNAIGGGWYAMERTPTSISIWFWPRNSAQTPPGLGTPVVDTSTFGTPDAAYVNTYCDFGSHFGAHNIIFDTTLCGDWAGAPGVYPSTCPSSCVDHVNSNPSAFSDAYWDVGGLYVYQKIAPHPQRHVVHGGSAAFP